MTPVEEEPVKIEVFAEIHDRTANFEAAAGWASGMIRAGYQVRVQQEEDETGPYVHGIAY